MRTGETCALPAGFRTRDDAPDNRNSWQFEVDLRASRLWGLVLVTAAIALPTLAPAQQPSEPLTPGLPAKPEGQKGAGIPAAPPIPDTSKRATSTPAEKPVTPAQPPPRPTQ